MSDDEIRALSESDEATTKYIQKELGYFISYENLFSTWLSYGNDFNVSDVRDALSAFERLIHVNHKKLFDGIFTTLQTGLSKLGESAAAQTKAISSLLQLIKDIPMDGKQDYDVLGYIYEYLIEKFAANAGKKAGEFYTPHEVSVLMSEIIAHHLKDKEKIEIYDPTSGSGSLLINIGNSVAKDVRVTVNQFLAKTVAYALDVEHLLLLSYLGVKNNMQQQISQLLLYLIIVVTNDGIAQLVCFFYCVGTKAFVGLLPVPRTLFP